MICKKKNKTNNRNIKKSITLSKLAQYTQKSRIPLNWEKMVVMEGKKLKGNSVWSANRGKVVCREYKYSYLF